MKEECIFFFYPNDTSLCHLLWSLGSSLPHQKVHLDYSLDKLQIFITVNYVAAEQLLK